MKGYSKGYCWATKPRAEQHAKELRRKKVGVIKKKVYSGVKIKKQGGKYCTYAKESKNYLRWLRTGKV